MSVPIKPREQAAILSSLRAGVVPRVGLQHLQVGRKDEVAAILNDLAQIEQGGASVRFIIGRFGAGKSFFLNLCRLLALEKKLVVVQADLALERRLYGTGGQVRALHSELLRNLATRAKPEGGALPSVVERWVADVNQEVLTAGGADSDVTGEIIKRLKPLQDLVSGYDFANVIAKYLEGYQTHNEALMDSAMRWLRAEFGTKTEAREALGVRAIIDDADSYDYLKLLAAFVRLAGYAGLLVNLDELGVLSHRLQNSKARDGNYESILRILNDCLQGQASGIGFFFAGVDEFLEDRRRGLYSYEALRSRLEQNQFARDGLKDFSSPVIKLANLSQEDLFVLLLNIRNVFALGDPARHLVPDEAIPAFMTHCSRRLGAAYFQTPRDTVKGFVQLLSVLEQNPGSDWKVLLEASSVEQSADPDGVGRPAEPAPILQAAKPAEAKPAETKTEADLTDFRLKPS